MKKHEQQTGRLEKISDFFGGSNFSKRNLLLTCFAVLLSFGAAALELPVTGRLWPMYLTGNHAPADSNPQSMKKITMQRERGKAVATLGHKTGPYCGMALTPEPDGAFFDFSAGTVFCVEVTNLQTKRTIDITVGVNSGADRATPAHRVTTSFSLDPGETRVLKVPLRKIDPSCRVKLPSGELEWLHGLPPGMPQFLGSDAKQVSAIIIYSVAPFLDRNDKASTRFAVGRTWLTDELPESTVPLSDPAKFFPFIDRYGQFRHEEWPEKIHSDEQLRESRERESAELERIGRPAEWSRYGGWAAGPRLEATGSFRTEKYRGKWFLVDPDGYLFFSNGVNDIRFDAYAEMPPDRANWMEVPKSGAVRFYADNLRLKYGTTQPCDFVHRRLAVWGINTIGAWSSPELILKKRTPYTAIVVDWSQAGLIGRKFFDPFDPAFRADLKRRFTETWIKETVNDPYCIGYFITNELEYGPENQGWKTDCAVAMMAIAAKPGTPAKLEFLKDLRQKYRTVGELNRAWGTNYASFEAFPESMTIPETAEAKRDMEAFHWKTVEEFFKLSRDMVREYAPGKLYLGARLSERNNTRWGKFANIYGKYCDVASYNLYHCNYEYFRPEVGDKPVMITETHMNILQRGMFHSGLRAVGITPEDRALAVKRAYYTAFRHPSIVGVHWFLWNDEPLTGRPPANGENLNAGLVDITDTPYPELTGTLRKLGGEAVKVRLEGH